MSDVRILTEDDLRTVVALDLTVVNCIDAAFRALSGDGVVMPPVLSMHLPDVNGEVDIKTAFLPGCSGFAVKVSPGFFDNPSKGLPSTSGLMILFAHDTGQVQAVLLDNGYLTDLRTAAAGAVAARALSRPDSTKATILGAGVQAQLQLQALKLVRPIQSATFWARDMEKAKQAAKSAEATLGIQCSAAQDCETAVSDADVIVTTTPAKAPILEAQWLHPGQHVTAMGSDQSDKSELDPSCLTRADIYVPDRLSQTRVMGELRGAIDAGLVGRDQAFSELGDILTSAAPARTTPQQITIADLTGTGIQDTAIATHALAAFKRSKVAP